MLERRCKRSNQRAGGADEECIGASWMVVVVHRGRRVERHQLQRLKVDADDAVLAISAVGGGGGRRQLTGQRRQCSDRCRR